MIFCHGVGSEQKKKNKKTSEHNPLKAGGCFFASTICTLSVFLFFLNDLFITSCRHAPQQYSVPERVHCPAALNLYLIMGQVRSYIHGSSPIRK